MYVYGLGCVSDVFVCMLCVFVCLRVCSACYAPICDVEKCTEVVVMRNPEVSISVCTNREKILLKKNILFQTAL